MSPRYLLALDIGSGGCRALITTPAGEAVSWAHHDLLLETPEELAPLGREFNPDRLWKALCRLIKEAVGKASIAPADIAGLSATSQREALVFLDRRGREIYTAPNTDLRALFEGMSIDEEHGRETHAITGHTPSFLFAPAKLKWFATNRPDLYEQIACLLTLGDWVLYRLCGEKFCEVSSASEAGLFDLKKRCWSQTLIEKLGVPPHVFPELKPSGSLVGRVARKAAAETGLVPGTRVLAGGADTQCGLLGMGVKAEGEAGIVAGWSAPAQMVTSQPVLDPDGRLWTGCHLLPGKWVLESSAGEAGNALAWLKAILFDEKGGKAGEKAFVLMDGLAQRIPPGAEGVLAFLGPRAMDMTRLKLDQGGFLFSVPLSASPIGRGHLVRAALENLAFALRANCAQLEQVAGMSIRGVSFGGGLARSHCLAQIVAEVLQRAVQAFETEQVTALGAAMAAATGCGFYASLEEASAAMKPQPTPIEPDPGRSAEYVLSFERWQRALAEMDRLSEV